MKRFFASLAGLLFAGIVLFAFYERIPYVSMYIQRQELRAIDYRMKFAPSQEISPAIHIVLVDDVNKLSDKLAAFIRLVAVENNGQFMPKVIGLNYRFDAAVNEELVNVASIAHNVYYGYSFVFDPQQAAPAPENQEILPFRMELTDISETTQHVFEAQRVELPSPRYLTTARSIGFVNTLPDSDGVFRRIPLFLKYQEHWYGSLPLLMAMDYLDIESVDMTFYPGQYVEMEREQGLFTDIPVNTSGEMLIDFAMSRTGEGLAPFQPVSMERDILANQANPAALAHVLSRFKDAIVLVGSGDHQRTPVSDAYPLIGMLANFMNNILTNHFLTEIAAPFVIGIVLAVGFFAGLLFGANRFLVKLLFALLLSAAYLGAAYGASVQFKLLLPVAPPLLTIALTLLFTSLFIRGPRTTANASQRFAEPERPAAEKKRKPTSASEDLKRLEHALVDIREDLDRKSYRLRSKAEELRLLQDEMDVNHSDYSRQVASLHKEIRAREIEIKGLLEKEDELRRQFENLPLAEGEGMFGRDASENMIRMCAKHGLMTKNPATLEVLYRIEKLGKSSVAILIQGEPGVGKTLLADIIRDLSPRHNRPMLHVVCDGDMDMLEDDLFGHRKGAFPSADEHRLGLLRKVDGGTLVLEEIGNLSLEIQTRLAQAARGKAVRPLGEDVTSPADVRMIATTTKPLRELVAQGKFREDLYHYFAVFPLALPPLRERKEDIPGLTAHFVASANRAHSKIVERVSDAAINLLIQHDWPGNVSELETVIERAIIHAPAGEKELTEDWLSIDDATLTGGIHDPGMLNYLIALLDDARELPAYQPLREHVLAQIQRMYCARLLRRHQGDIKHAAIDAGLKADTFKKMLTELDIDPERYRN